MFFDKRVNRVLSKLFFVSGGADGHYGGEGHGQSDGDGGNGPGGGGTYGGNTSHSASEAAAAAAQSNNYGAFTGIGTSGYDLAPDYAGDFSGIASQTVSEAMAELGAKINSTNPVDIGQSIGLTDAQISAVMAANDNAEFGNATMAEAITGIAFSKMSLSDRYDFARETYVVPTELAYAWGIVAPSFASTAIVTRAAAGMAAVTGQLTASQDSTGSFGTGPTLTTEQTNQLRDLGVSQSEEDSIRSAIATPLELRNYADEQAVIKKIGPRPVSGGADGQDWQDQFDGTMAMLKNGGHDLFDSAQGMGVPQWWTDYVRGRPSDGELTTANNVANDAINEGASEDANDGNEGPSEDANANDGNVVADDATVNSPTASFDVDQDLWNQFLDRASTDLEGLIKDNANFTTSEANKSLSENKYANTRDTNILKGLEQDLKYEKGTFTPTETSWGNYQPGTNFIKAKSLMSLSEGISDNIKDDAQKRYTTISDRSPSNGALQYLAALQELAAKDRTFDDTTRAQELDKYRADLGLTGTQYVADTNAEANEPGTLDNIISTVNVGKGIWDLGSGIYNALENVLPRG